MNPACSEITIICRHGSPPKLIQFLIIYGHIYLELLQILVTILIDHSRSHFKRLISDFDKLGSSLLKIHTHKSNTLPPRNILKLILYQAQVLGNYTQHKNAIFNISKNGRCVTDQHPRTNVCLTIFNCK